ncbi:3-deoxy-D-manno-octulosonic acid kinase [Marinobacter pelagius]|uniref:3-deoxy-D-manno-octulosonic acid kinase n=1 Tax=Marinobacter pelagius TaxID=379482 RepID=A0A366GNW3_9GAMM|nr:3-deoxy-D-manno-octulosonic acid kinase [Marinobacter pelagius]RBP29117.1 3-deoxy-D-manno-octulosonic acid kinase [Marinobacter pelagius]
MARSFQNRFREEWFDPRFWGDNAVPVTKGGRGSAWFIRSKSGGLVLRHFCRGGVPGRFIRREYVYTRADAVRSFVEFRLLHKLFRKGLPVPEPVAAGYSRRGQLFYHASIIIRRIPGARPLAEFASASCVSSWRDAGACVRRFHDAGVFHADLNCMNILVADNVYLIDFDRGRLMPAGKGDDWKTSNISRLERSVNKTLADLDAPLREQLWQAFLDGYGRS